MTVKHLELRWGPSGCLINHSCLCYIIIVSRLSNQTGNSFETDHIRLLFGLKQWPGL